MGDSLKECSKQMEEALEAIRAIRRNSDEINSIVSEIEDIAFRTNILSLNASVEAARAGEAGRGFGRGWPARSDAWRRRRPTPRR